MLGNEIIGLAMGVPVVGVLVGIQVVGLAEAGFEVVRW